MTDLVFNGTLVVDATDEQLASTLALASATPQFELWASVPDDGPSLCMLRSGTHAWLMYLREPGDNGVHSVGDAGRDGIARFRLDNGQVDDYPLAWCIEPDTCLAAISAFHANGGARAEHIVWAED